MTSLRVVSLVPYLTSRDLDWRTKDYVANKVVKCMKGRHFGGYFEILSGGKRRSYNNDNADEFVELLCRTIGDYLAIQIEREFTIVPIPNSGATIRDNDDFRTLILARKIAKHISHANVVPALRWKEARLSSHTGGSRDPRELYKNMELLKELNRPVVLFDDLITTSAHMVAATWRLNDFGIQPALGFAIGRSTREQEHRVVSWQEELISISR